MELATYTTAALMHIAMELGNTVEFDTAMNFKYVENNSNYSVYL